MSLLKLPSMDDVEDNSELRRGLPVAHQIYGIPQTINTANYVYFLAMQELIKLHGSVKGKERERDVIGMVTGEWIPNIQLLLAPITVGQSQ